MGLKVLKKIDYITNGMLHSKRDYLEENVAAPELH